MMHIGWSTTATREDATALARGLIEQHLAACVQIEGPITSLYHWQGRIETAEEYRLCIKFLTAQSAAVKAWLLAHHPYENPEWVTVRAEIVAEKYLSWARSSTNSAPL